MTHLPVCERQPLWEGSERSKLLILSPPNGFLSRSLFHNSPHSCGERANFTFPTISAVKSHSFAFCAALWECVTYECMPKGDGEGGKRGTGGENPEGEGGLQPGCPPFLGLSPQDAGRTVLRRSSTQIIKNKSQANGHKSKPVLRVPSTQSMLECTKGNSNQSRGRWAGHVSPCRPVCTVGCSRV